MEGRLISTITCLRRFGENRRADTCDVIISTQPETALAIFHIVTKTDSIFQEILDFVSTPEEF